MNALTRQIDEVLRWAAAATAGHTVSAELAGAHTRLHEPLRVAIAGRVKAGKSTLLNSLVGERLAKTDASECTRIVTWYRYGDAYSVEHVGPDGSRGELRFDRADGSLDIHLDGRDPAGIESIDVQWPARRLRNLTLIDTPGLESTTPEAGERTRRFLGIDSRAPGNADAVIYLMRHLHSSDVSFLETFFDRSVAQPSPFNAVAVLSRADELGAGRIDAMASAQSIAARFEEDRRVRALCSGVTAVGGLVAETAVTLIEEEVAALRQLARTDQEELSYMLLSVDHFSDPAVSEVSSQQRRHLLARLGLFGVRYCVRFLTTTPNTSTPALAAALLEESGLPALISDLEGRFEPRADVLKCRSALTELRASAGNLAGDDGALAADLLARAEQIEASSTELSELRLWQLITSPTIELADDEVGEIRALVSRTEPAERLGGDAGASDGELAAAALTATERWRTRAGHPLTDRATREVAELASRSYESLYASLVSDSNT
jgi:hypothetical protein